MRAILITIGAKYACNDLNWTHIWSPVKLWSQVYLVPSGDSPPWLNQSDWYWKHICPRYLGSSGYSPFSFHCSLKSYWPKSFTSMSSQVTRMKSASAKIIWRTILFKSLTIDFISPWTFNQIHIIWAMPVTCSKSCATCCRTITPCCPIRAISYAISTRLCWTLKLLITFKVVNF